MQEITDVIESHRRTKEAAIKNQAHENFILAELIANRVGYAFTDEKNRTDDMLHMPWDFYPGLFENEASKIEESRSEAELDNYKALRKKHAATWNKRFEVKEDGSGKTVSQSAGGDEGSTGSH